MTPDRTPSPLSLLIPGWVWQYVPSAVGGAIIVFGAIFGAFCLAGVM